METIRANRIANAEVPSSFRDVEPVPVDDKYSVFENTAGDARQTEIAKSRGLDSKRVRNDSGEGGHSVNAPVTGSFNA